MTNIIDKLTGKRIGFLKIIQYAGARQWQCRCFCGTHKNISGDLLLAKAVRSCGCVEVDGVVIRATYNALPRQVGVCHRMCLGGVDMLIHSDKPDNKLYGFIKMQGALPSGKPLPPCVYRFTVNKDSTITAPAKFYDPTPLELAGWRAHKML